MRILHVTRDYPPHTRGGISIAVEGAARALRQAGHDVAVISFDDFRPTKGPPPIIGRLTLTRPDGVSVVRVGGVWHLEAARAFATDFAADVVHVHDGMLWPFGRGLVGTRHLFYVHVDHAAMNRIRGVTEATRSLTAQNMAFTEADAVWVPSEHTAKAVSSRLAGSPRVVGLGLRRPSVAEVTDRSPNEVLYAGRFDEAKGTADFLTATAYVAEHQADATFSLAGGIPGNPSAERRWIRRFEEQAPAALRERVRFLGWLTPSELRTALARAAVVVLPSWQETFGLTALEAMGQRAPIVAARGGATVELLEHEETALLVGAQLPVALADAVLTLLADPKHAASLGEKAFAVAAERYAWSDVVGPWLEGYEAALSGS